MAKKEPKKHFIGSIRVYTTQEAADSVKVSKNTLLRWIYKGEANGGFKDVEKSRTKHRVWYKKDMDRLKEYAENRNKKQGKLFKPREE